MEPPPGVEVTLQVSPGTILQGERLSLDLQLRNISGNQVEYAYPDYAHDFIVEGPDGVVWAWVQSYIAPGNTGFTSDVNLEVLVPGELRHKTRAWDQEDCLGRMRPLPPGRYSTRGVWVTHSDDPPYYLGWWSEPVEFEIRGRAVE